MYIVPYLILTEATISVRTQANAWMMPLRHSENAEFKVVVVEWVKK